MAPRRNTSAAGPLLAAGLLGCHVTRRAHDRPLCSAYSSVSFLARPKSVILGMAVCSRRPAVRPQDRWRSECHYSAGARRGVAKDVGSLRSGDDTGGVGMGRGAGQGSLSRAPRGGQAGCRPTPRPDCRRHSIPGRNTAYLVAADLEIARCWGAASGATTPRFPRETACTSSRGRSHYEVLLRATMRCKQMRSLYTTPMPPLAQGAQDGVAGNRSTTNREHCGGPVCSWCQSTGSGALVRPSGESLSSTRCATSSPALNASISSKGRDLTQQRLQQVRASGTQLRRARRFHRARVVVPAPEQFFSEEVSACGILGGSGKRVMVSPPAAPTMRCGRVGGELLLNFKAASYKVKQNRPPETHRI